MLRFFNFLWFLVAVFQRVKCLVFFFSFIQSFLYFKDVNPRYSQDPQVAISCLETFSHPQCGSHSNVCAQRKWLCLSLTSLSNDFFTGSFFYPDAVKTFPACGCAAEYQYLANVSLFLHNILLSCLRLGEDFKSFKQASLNISRCFTSRRFSDERTLKSFGSRRLSYKRIGARHWSWFW